MSGLGRLWLRDEDDYISDVLNGKIERDRFINTVRDMLSEASDNEIMALATSMYDEFETMQETPIADFGGKISTIILDLRDGCGFGSWELDDEY